MLKIYRFIRLYSFVFITLLGISQQSYAMPIVRQSTLILTPPAGANDLHMDYWQKEAAAAMIPGTAMVGVRGNPNPPVNVAIPNPVVNMGGIPPHGGLPAQPIANTWVGTDFSTANGAPFAMPLTIDFKVQLQSQNTLHTQGYWTTNGVPGEIFGQWGWAWGPSTAIGNGQFSHKGQIFNDSPTKPLLLQNLSFFADLAFKEFVDLTFSSVFLASTTIAPLSTFDFALTTNDSMLGGHIYFTFDVLQSPLVHVIGDHPIDAVVSSPSTISLVFLALLIIVYRNGNGVNTESKGPGSI